MPEAEALDFRTVLDAVPDHAAIVDVTGRIVHVNHSWIAFARENNCKMPEGGLGANYLQICEAAGGIDRSLALQARDGLLSVIQGHAGEFYLEYPCHAPDHKRWFLLKVRPIRRHSAPPYDALVLHDNITSWRIVQEKLAWSNAELSQFMYFASNDLQEPVRWISGFAELLATRYKDSLGEDGREFLEYILTSATRMSVMIRDVLTYSKLLNGGDLRFESVDLKALAEDVLTQYEHISEEQEARIVCEDLPVVSGVARLLEQVFRHLISNALKYSPGRPEVRISAERLGTSWVVAVSDRGVGIPEESREKIFLPFQTLRERGSAGSGLGLALVRKIVDLHGGRIWVESEVGRGSTFFFSIPDVPTTS